MSRKKFNVLEVTGYGVAIAVFSSVVFFSLNCTATPIEGRASAWNKVSAAPPGAASLFASDDTHVWLVGSESDEAVIWRWYGTKLVEEFRYGEKKSDLHDIDFFGRTGWAVGEVNAAGKRSGLLLRYEDGSWTRVLNVPESRTGFSKVSASSRDGCWLMGYGEVFRYERENWTRFGDLPNACDIGFCNPGRGFITTDLGPYIWVFDGAGWVRENVVLPPGFSTSRLSYIAPIPEGAFFNCSLFTEGLSEFYYGAILRRDAAPPGEGTYDLVFFAPPGPYFSHVSGLSYADGGNGIAVGYLTSVACEDGVYYEEILDRDFGTPFAVAVLGPRDYWMLAKTEQGGNILARYKK